MNDEILRLANTGIDALAQIKRIALGLDPTVPVPPTPTPAEPPTPTPTPAGDYNLVPYDWNNPVRLDYLPGEGFGADGTKIVAVEFTTPAKGTAPNNLPGFSMVEFGSNDVARDWCVSKTPGSFTPSLGMGSFANGVKGVSFSFAIAPGEPTKFFGMATCPVLEQSTRYYLNVRCSRPVPQRDSYNMSVYLNRPGDLV